MDHKRVAGEWLHAAQHVPDELLLLVQLHPRQLELPANGSEEEAFNRIETMKLK
jgi:hypothetical protein